MILLRQKLENKISLPSFSLFEAVTISYVLEIKSKTVLTKFLFF